MSLERVEVPGGTVRAVVLGDGQGVPVLYLHGFEHHPGEPDFFHSIAAGRRLFAPEHPGYGGSTTTAPMTDVVDVVLFYRDLLDERGLDQVDVIGHCLGGMLAAELAAIAPDRVRRLVLVSSYGLWMAEPELVDPFGLSPDALAAAKWHDPTLAASEPSIEAHGEADYISAAITRSENLATAAKYLWPFPDRGLRRRLGHVAAPTLVVHGTSDGLIPIDYAHELVGLIRNAELVEVGSAGHLPMIEQKATCCDGILAFLDGA